MFPAKAHGHTVFDFNPVGVDAACCHQAKEGLPLFIGMPLVTPPMNAIVVTAALIYNAWISNTNFPRVVPLSD